MNARAAKRKGRAQRSLSHAIKYSLWAASAFLVRASFDAVINADRRDHNIHGYVIKAL